MANSPGGFIPSKIVQQAIQARTERATLARMAKQREYFEHLSHNPPPTPPGNGGYAADGTFTAYAVYDVGIYDVDPYGL